MTTIRPRGTAFFMTVMMGLAAWIPTVASGQGVVLPFDAPVLAGDTQTHFRGVLDYDGDGFTDTVSAYFGQGAVIVRGYRNLAGVLTPDWSVTYAGVYTPWLAEPKAALATGDLNGDGKDDFVFSISQTVGVWLSNGAGVVPTIAYGFTEPGLVDQILAADFDGDGLCDFALREVVQLRVWKSQPSGAPLLVSSATLGTLGNVTQIFLVDASGDGTMDIGSLKSGFWLTTTVELYTLPAGPILVPAATYLTLSNFTAQAAAGDLDGDGDQDIALFGNNQTVLLRRTAPTTFVVEPAVTGSPASRLVDFDQDGDLDAIGIGFTPYPFAQDGFLTLSLNAGAGSFSAIGPFEWTAVNSLSSSGIAGTVDLDLDGNTDLVAGNCVYYGRGADTDAAFGLTCYGPRDLVDLDGDGDPDSVPGAFIGSNGPASPVMRPNRGDGTGGSLVGFGPPAPTGFSWRGPGFPGDFDGDGDLDVLVDTVAGLSPLPATSTRLLRNLGSGVFVDQGLAVPAGLAVSSVVNPPVPQCSFAVDLDGDSDLDLVVTDLFNTTPTTTVWWNQGSGSFVPGPTFSQCRVLSVEHMNQDAFRDLVVQINPSSLSILFGQSGGFGNGPILDSDCLAAALGDFDGDGDHDIFSVGSASTRLFSNNGNGSFAPPVIFVDLAPVSPPGIGVHRIFAVDVDADGLTDVVSLSPLGAVKGMAILRRNGPGGAFGPVVRQALQPGAFCDIDGDGDPDAVADVFTGARFLGRNLRFTRPASGHRRQYGLGTAGAGGIVPILGESGPFRPGASCELRIRGALGGAPGLLGIGAVPDSTSVLGITLLIVPDLMVPIQLGGTPGAAGEGTFSVPFTMPPSLFGMSFFHQAGFFDSSAPAGFSATNGLRIDVGF